MEEREAIELADEITRSWPDMTAYTRRTSTGWEVHVYWTIDRAERFTSRDEVRAYATGRR